jgi:hypothetical protein
VVTVIQAEDGQRIPRASGLTLIAKALEWNYDIFALDDDKVR